MIFFNHCPLKALRQGDWKPPFRQCSRRLCSQGSLIQCRWSVALGQKLRSLSETDATQRASAEDGALGRGSVFLLAASAARTVPCSLASAEGDVPQPPPGAGPTPGQPLWEQHSRGKHQLSCQPAARPAPLLPLPGARAAGWGARSSLLGRCARVFQY